jgi:hypothetical protein
VSADREISCPSTGNELSAYQEDLLSVVSRSGRHTTNTGPPGPYDEGSTVTSQPGSNATGSRRPPRYGPERCAAGRGVSVGPSRTGWGPKGPDISGNHRIHSPITASSQMSYSPTRPDTACRKRPRDAVHQRSTAAVKPAPEPDGRYQASDQRVRLHRTCRRQLWSRMSGALPFCFRQTTRPTA